jgi:hypothetical protein
VLEQQEPVQQQVQLEQLKPKKKQHQELELEQPRAATHLRD